MPGARTNGRGRIVERAGAVSVTAHIDLSGLRGAANDFMWGVREGVIAEGERWEDGVTEWAKQNAPWEDVTGNARGSIGFNHYFGFSVLYFVLTGGVAYMKHLETREAGATPILKPAMELHADSFIEAIGARRT